MGETDRRRIRVIGGGAAGYFAAIACAQQNSGFDIAILEASKQPLQKVRISGGGRCNVTAACFDPAQLVEAYPRGGKELRGPFSRFQPRDTMAWFEQHEVPLKTEADGRVFPQSDQSASIVDCLESAAAEAGARVVQSANVNAISVNPHGEFEIGCRDGQREVGDRVLVATGSAPSGYELARMCGHTIVPCVPSLFSFKIHDDLLSGLSGISFADVVLRLEIGGKKVAQERGPVLITHWGLSGPAAIRLSAWGARALHDAGYRADLQINWLGEMKGREVDAVLRQRREQAGRKVIVRDVPFGLPKRFWTQLARLAGVTDEMTWANLTHDARERIGAALTEGRLEVIGRGEFKEEFVTCGGVALREVDFRTMESRVQPGLYFAGEILDIDGITGGYNFQSAWTTGWIAGRSMAE